MLDTENTSKQSPEGQNIGSENVLKSQEKIMPSEAASDVAAKNTSGNEAESRIIYIKSNKGAATAVVPSEGKNEGDSDTKSSIENCQEKNSLSEEAPVQDSHFETNSIPHKAYYEKHAQVDASKAEAPSRSIEKSQVDDVNLEPKKQLTTIKISKSHHKILSKIQRGAKKLKLFPKPVNYKQPIWERRGQTFEQYQKRDTSGVEKFYGVNPTLKPHIKKEANPNSITSRKITMRIAGARVKDSTRAVIRRMMGV